MGAWPVAAGRFYPGYGSTHLSLDQPTKIAGAACIGPNGKVSKNSTGVMGCPGGWAENGTIINFGMGDKIIKVEAEPLLPRQQFCYTAADLFNPGDHNIHQPNIVRDR